MNENIGRNLHYVANKRRVREDKRFVTGKGKYVQDINLPDTKHAAVLPSPYPRARILSIDTAAAEALDGVHMVLTGEQMAVDCNPIRLGLKLPEINWYPLAVGMTCYVGEWVAIAVADDPYIAEDALDLIEVEYEPLPAVVDPEQAFADTDLLVHPGHGSNVLYHGNFLWGTVAEDFAAADDSLTFRARWGRSSTVPIETFGALARWDEGTEIMDIWASIQMPNFVELMATTLGYPLNCIRLHQDVDVGGSYGVKRGIKQSVLVAYLSRKLHRPVRFIEDRLANMAGSDAHGPDRIFDTDVAFNKDGVIRSLKIRALDDAGAYPGRAPFQLAKPISAIVGPYKINSVKYEAISVCTNKSGQVPVRGFGQAPTNYMIETAVDNVARHLGLDRLEVRRRNLIQADEFPYQIPPGSKYDSGNYPVVLRKCLDLARYDELLARRDQARAEGRLAGIGIATVLEPGGGNNIFEYLMDPSAEITTFMEGCEVRVDAQGNVTGIMGTTTSGQGHETMMATILGEELQFDPDDIRIVHADSLNALPTRSPIASRMAIMLGSAAAGAAGRIKGRAMAIAAHNLEREVEDLEYAGGTISDRNDPSRKLTWAEICFIAYRAYHKLPPGMEPGFQAQYVFQVPGGGQLPDENNRVQVYPCFSFQAHIPYVEIDPGTGRVTVVDYAIAHDCGTVINPDIVRGMVIGGLAHGIGAALYEKFAYDDEGQFLSATFADYLMPSVHEIPDVKDVEHCTPSPLTSHGQKGSGEGGYLGAPAAIASAVNDALAPLGHTIHELPMRMHNIEALINSGNSE
ncbi:MAG: xanthine dehydrogenase family protein [Rhodospirillaceae bacterium]|jgi:2-furoyl-CoA dehydrogenase large subunit|nr:xanthine dehydrogenase family protein [Rhodospirillaceae bacterium]MBT5082133.1 xanthine dehydrogenase family protein [Rhodospirillaceae bacterium]MBT5879049.1 xanthine dehydrogenase family protein [Rhodospirillaceae bacterium]MBT6589368.1 xanthine dehydrogenase family protein [Rhodospirillaceae bacterium]MBT6985887.1 xanthine dehydrogenase family protein [Rhodospirillaceae bacterium]